MRMLAAVGATDEVTAIGGSSLQGESIKIDPPRGAWTGGGSRARRHVCRKYLGPVFQRINKVLTS